MQSTTPTTEPAPETGSGDLDWNNLSVLEAFIHF